MQNKRRRLGECLGENNRVIRSWHNFKNTWVSQTNLLFVCFFFFVFWHFSFQPTAFAVVHSQPIPPLLAPFCDSDDLTPDQKSRVLLATLFLQVCHLINHSDHPHNDAQFTYFLHPLSHIVSLLLLLLLLLFLLLVFLLLCKQARMRLVLARAKRRIAKRMFHHATAVPIQTLANIDWASAQAVQRSAGGMSSGMPAPLNSCTSTHSRKHKHTLPHAHLQTAEHPINTPSGVVFVCATQQQVFILYNSLMTRPSL